MSSISLVLLAACTMAVLGNCYGYPLEQLISSTTNEIEKTSNSVNSFSSDGSSITKEQSYDYESNYQQSQQSDSLLTTPNGLIQNTQQQSSQLIQNAQQQSDLYNSNSKNLIQDIQQNGNLYPSDELLSQQQRVYNAATSSDYLAQQQSESYTNGLYPTDSNLSYSAYNSLDYDQERTTINNTYEILNDSDDSDDSS